MHKFAAAFITPVCMISASPALAQFTPEQESAFSQGAGITGANFAAFLAAFVAALAFCGIAWIGFAAYRQWASGQSGAGSIASLAIRASVLLIIVGLFVG